MEKISVCSIELEKTFANTIFLCPNGHEVCPINPSGFQWFDLAKDDLSTF